MAAIPKPRRIRDPGAIAEARRDYCEYCGRVSHGGPHHIVTRGAYGPDIVCNLVQLCYDCHYGKVPSGKLSKQALFELVARREGMTVEEVERMVYEARRRECE